MTVLLTGIGGAIGVHLMAHIMHNTDWNVVGIDSFRHKGYYDRVTEICRDHPDWPKRIKIIHHDLVAPLTKRQIEQIGDVEYIINLASLSDVQASIDDPVPFIRNNSELMLNILEYARVAKPKAFLHFSTDEVYGSAAIDQGHKEWATILPSNPYAASKAAQEAYAIAYWRTYGVPLILTNTMNNFGETQSPSKFPAMIQKNVMLNRITKIHATSDGQIGTRYYLHSRNASDAVLFILKNTKPYMHKPGEVDRPDRYNIVGDKQVSNLELALTIARLMGKELRYELQDFHSTAPGHDLHYGLDGEKLTKLGWTSPRSFEDSLKETLDWQQKNERWMK